MRDQDAINQGQRALRDLLQGRNGPAVITFLRSLTIERQKNPEDDEIALRVHAAECRFARTLIGLADEPYETEAEDDG